MSAPLFFHSAGQEDLKFWGENDGPAVVVWKFLSKSEQEQRSKTMCKWFGADGGKKTKTNTRLEKKSGFSNRSKQTKAKAGEKMD